MALSVVWTRYGNDAALALHNAVAAAKHGDPLAPVTVVVPSNHVGVASRRLLASGKLGAVAGTGVGLAAVTFLTTYRLAELLGAASLAATGRRPVSTPVLAAAMRAELAARPGLFEPVAEHPATESALVSTYRELRDVSEEALVKLASTSARAAEVVRLHTASRNRLAQAWYDEEDLLDAATAQAGSGAAGDLGAVVVHLPQRLSLHSARLLRALAEHLDVTVVAGCTGIAEADAEVLESARRVGIDVEGGTPPPFLAHVAPDRTTILTASDADDEVRAAVRVVVEAVREGTRLDRIAVLHASAEPYARTAHEQLKAAGIATNGAAVLPLAARMAGRTLLELLTMPDNDFRRQDVLAWLSAGPIRTDGRWAPTAAWERISRDAGIVAGRPDWDANLVTYAEQQEKRAEELEHDDDEPDWAAERARERARRARELRSFVLGHIDGLAAASSAPRPWSSHVAWAREQLDQLLDKPHRREGWPPDERKAAERIDLALQRLAALDHVEEVVTLEVFHRTLELELEADLGRVGRFGDGVLVGSVEMGIGLDLDLVVVLGLAEGSFPSTVHDDSLLPDHERLACDGELSLRADRVERQHRHLLGALAGASRQLLCVPRGDLRRSMERVPSRWLVDLARQIETRADADPVAQSVDALAGALHIASFDAGLRSMAPATPQEHRLRSLLSVGGALRSTDDPQIALGSDVTLARRSSSFTRFDGNLAGVPVKSPVGATTSPTRLERWAVCPGRHLVEDLLGAAPVENPEDSLTITPLDKGNLVHEALEDFLREVLERPEGDRPRPADRWTAQDRARLREIGEAKCAQYEALGLTGRRIFWQRERRRILLDLDEVLTRDEVHRRLTTTTPVAVELAFGFPSRDGDPALPPVSITLPDGRVLEVRGRADRVDVAHDGTVHVVDYKTGKYASGYKAIKDDDPVVGGKRLQLPIYGLAGRLHRSDPAGPVHAEYWFVTSAGGFRRHGYQVTDAILDRTVATLATIVEGIEAGVFPLHPDAGSTATRVSCRTCDPDGLGTAELRQQWDRKRFEPGLATYAQLAEPLDEPEAEEQPA